MIVNISPADYNYEETQTSLYYAQRVKVIVNETVKNVETKEFSRMKEQMRLLGEERDVMKTLLQKNGISFTNRSSLPIMDSTPTKSDDERYDEGPIYNIPINESFK
jgi:hypothetical protein